MSVHSIPLQTKQTDTVGGPSPDRPRVLIGNTVSPIRSCLPITGYSNNRLQVRWFPLRSVPPADIRGNSQAQRLESQFLVFVAGPTASSLPQTTSPRNRKSVAHSGQSTSTRGAKKLPIGLRRAPTRFNHRGTKALAWRAGCQASWMKPTGFTSGYGCRHRAFSWQSSRS